MKRSIVCRLLVSLTFLLLSESNLLAQEYLNQPIRLLNGEQVTLEKYKGNKPVYLKFWATWCKPCREQMPHFESVQQQYGNEIEVIGINLGIYDDQPAVQSALKQFGLTMKTAMDTNGDLAQRFGLQGTPYHLLFDKNMKLVHSGNNADEALDNKIKLLSQKQLVDSIDNNLVGDGGPTPAINLADGKTHALFFTSTWCDWYLADSKPDVAKRCATAPKNINELAKQYPGVVWHGVVTRLWTGEKDLKDYQKKFSLSYPAAIDTNNYYFYKYKISDFNTLLLIKNNQVVSKLNGADKLESLKEKVKAML